MPNIFDIDSIFFTLWNYPMSYLEFLGVVTGAVAVWLSANANVWSWPIGAVSVAIFFFLYFQNQIFGWLPKFNGRLFIVVEKIIVITFLPFFK